MMHGMKTYPKLKFRASLDSISGEEDGKYREQRRKRSEANIKFLEKHPALANDKLAAALTRHAIKKELAVHKSNLVMDSMHDDDEAEIAEEMRENEGKAMKEHMIASANPYEVVQKGGGVVVRNKATGSVKGHFGSRRQAMRQFRLLEGIEHGWTPTKGKR